MKRLYAILLFLIVLFAAGLAALIALTGSYTDKDSGGDVLILNEIAHLAAGGKYDDMPTYREYVILDNNGNILYDSRPGANGQVTVETAVQKRYPYKYIIVNGRITGSVILTDGEKRTDILYRRIIAGYCICGTVIIAAVLVLGAYIRRSIILPFGNMRDFASDVAAGDLDRPLTMDKENMFGAFSESFDIMREELKASRARELSLQKKERELVASLSHDIRTPVTGIKLTSELMAAVFSQNEGRELTVTADMTAKMNNICKRADEIDILVSDLFSSALADLGEFKVNCTDEDSAVIAEMIPKYDNRGLVRAEDIPEVIVRIDKTRLSQVIGNIISNSYKYAGTPIDISYCIEDGFLSMEIADHGNGVAEEETELITNKFYRGKNSADKEGSGLGLYISKMLMEKAGGGLTVRNDDGLCVGLLIPLS